MIVQVLRASSYKAVSSSATYARDKKGVTYLVLYVYVAGTLPYEHCHMNIAIIMHEMKLVHM